MQNIEMVPSEITFTAWANNEIENLNLTTEEAGLLLGYVLGHGYGVCLDATDTILCVDTEEPENGVVTKGFEELIEKVSNWNYEFLEDSETVGTFREQILMDEETLKKIMDRMP